MAARKGKRAAAKPRLTAKQKRNRIAYARRDERARALGYKGYYDYRAHDNGRLAPDAPRLSGQPLARARGHVGAEDLVRDIREGDVVTLIDGVDAIEIDDRGRYVLIRKRVLSFTGRAREYSLRNLTKAQLVALIKREVAAGATFSPAPSLDQRRIVSRSESPDGY